MPTKREPAPLFDDSHRTPVPTGRMLVAFFVVSCFMGCRHDCLRFNSTCDKMLADTVAYKEACETWVCYKSGLRNLDCARDIRRGFIDGYCETAKGGDGKTPTVPNSRYWSTLYQSRHGQQRINAWYQGYPHGVAAARKRGHGYYLRTPVTEEVSAFFAATSPQGQRLGLQTPHQQHPAQPVQQLPQNWNQQLPQMQHQQPQLTNGYIEQFQHTPNQQMVPYTDLSNQPVQPGVEYHEYLDFPSDQNTDLNGLNLPSGQQKPVQPPTTDSSTTGGLPGGLYIAPEPKPAGNPIETSPLEVSEINGPLQQDVNPFAVDSVRDAVQSATDLTGEFPDALLPDPN